MKRSQTKNRAKNIQRGWTVEAKDVTFGELTQDEHRKALQEVEKEEEDAQRYLKLASACNTRRDQKLNDLNEKNMRVHHGALSHPSYGPDCALVRIFGYVIKSMRASGLTRKETSGEDKPAEEAQSEEDGEG
jgi:hypothetical protein